MQIDDRALQARLIPDTPIPDEVPPGLSLAAALRDAHGRRFVVEWPEDASACWTGPLMASHAKKGAPLCTHRLIESTL